MIGRIWRYVIGSYPPVVSTLFAVCCAYGATALFATVDPNPGSWRPDLGTAIGAVTLMLDLLLMRVIDDIRDLGYDQVQNPKRPLPRGVVRIADLMVLYAVGVVIILAVNVGRGPALALIAGQLGYGLLVLAVHHWVHWPDGDHLVVSLLVSCPAQILLYLYLYAGYLRSTGHFADSSVWAALAVLVLASLHLELAKKIVRVPKPGERSYVATLGLRTTVLLAMVAPVAAAAVLLAASQPWSPWTLAVLVPLVLPLVALARFLRPTNRWHAQYSGFYLLLTLISFALPGLATTGS
jgi:hypothetical protein